MSRLSNCSERFKNVSLILIAIILCMFCVISSQGRHIKGHIDIVNIQINRENMSLLPEALFDIRLKGTNEYSVVYKEKKPIEVKEQHEIEKWLGGEKSIRFRYVDVDDCKTGIMPLFIRQLFDKIDALCATNGVDYFVASIDSIIVDNGEYSRGLSFVITNTPPSLTALENMHPVLGKMISPDFCSSNSNNTNAVPIGANPSKWFCH